MKKSLEFVINKLLCWGKKFKVKVVFIGGIAINILAQPRTTYDIDIYVSIDDDFLKKFFNFLNSLGFKSKIIKAKLFKDIKFYTFYNNNLKLYIDIFLPITEFQEKIIERAKKIKFKGLPLYIASTEDMVLLKLLSLRERDMEDVRLLLEQKVDYKYLNSMSEKLGIKDILNQEIKFVNNNIKR